MFRRILSICMMTSCQRLLGSYTEPATTLHHPGVSHGLCADCAERVYHLPPRENRRAEG